jgi:hypothetical protein
LRRTAVALLFLTAKAWDTPDKTITKTTQLSDAAIDSTHLTRAEATRLYKEELLKPSPVDIGKLKYFLSKHVDIHTTPKR